MRPAEDDPGRWAGLPIPGPAETPAGARPPARRGFGDGAVIVQAQGITAVNSRDARIRDQRHGFTAVPYDARGHGESDAAPPGEEYACTELARDMGAVVESQSAGGRVVLAGHSMGAHTAAAYALAEPDRIAGLVAIGPASRGLPPSPETIAYWDGLAAGLERGGVEGFIEVYDDGSHDPGWRDVVLQLARRRLGLHRDLNAVAAALRSTTRSIPFDGLEALEAMAVPTLVVASHDEADPGHPKAVAEVDPPDPGSAHGDRGRGRVAARLAGRLARDRRVLRGVRGARRLGLSP